MSKERFRGLISISLAVIIWASSYVIREDMVKEVSGGEIVFVQVLIAALILIIYNKVKKISIKMNIKTAVIVMAMGALGISGYQISVNNAMQYVSSTMAAVFCALIPVMCYFVEAYKQKRINPLAIIGLGLSFVGVIFMSSGEGLTFNATGIIFLLVSDIIWVLYCIMIKEIKIEADFSVVLLYQVFGAAIAAFFVSSFQGIATIVTQTKFIAPMIFLAAFNSILALVLFTYAIKTIGVTLTNIMNNAMPIVTMGISFMAFGRPATYKQIIGIAFTFTAVIIINKIIESNMSLEEEQISDTER